jgi:hypothetical protein
VFALAFLVVSMSCKPLVPFRGQASGLIDCPDFLISLHLDNPKDELSNVGDSIFHRKLYDAFTTTSLSSPMGIRIFRNLQERSTIARVWYRLGAAAIDGAQPDAIVIIIKQTSSANFQYLVRFFSVRSGVEQSQ